MEEKPAREEGGVPEQEGEAETGRFSEFDELRRDIERRIRDNHRFLERFMEEDFQDEEAEIEESPGEEEL